MLGFNGVAKLGFNGVVKLDLTPHTLLSFALKRRRGPALLCPIFIGTSASRCLIAPRRIVL